MSPLKLVTGPVAATRSSAGASFAKLLSKRMERPVELVATPTYGELLETVSEGLADIAWLPPAVYVRAADRSNVVLVVSGVRQHRAHFRGALFCRRDRPYRDVRDAEGSVVAWVDRNSCAGYLFPRLALQDIDVIPDRFFDRERLMGDHYAVVQAVVDGEADVGATFVHSAGENDLEIINTGWKLMAPDTPMRTLVLTDPIPSDTLCAGAHTSPETRDEFGAAIGSLHESAEGKEVLRDLFGVERFEPSLPAHYEVVRRALTTA